ncbi:hypothetical protein B4102_2284 [Heyndrickxia sporothermodurans]|uniref:Uncharacterized protein n=1 Tax=Heyndrickxia sporothermodurans TaxID=46224 RepID=A0A150LFT8_9BACI|nr:hypothetical protein [Heyndrickxia sporothermodurans]KYD11100.1 hypothetical protein B4102_2284 [Heyndrickxia sporothermodurans]
MGFGIFVSLFILSILLFIVSIFLFVKRKKYGIKAPIATSVIFIILLCIVIPLGNQPEKGDYKKEASTFSYDRYLNGSVPEGTIVKVQGQVISLDKFTIDQEEVFLLDSEDGAFYVKNNNVDSTEIKDGEMITVYGGYAGNGDSKSPSINAQIIEK